MALRRCWRFTGVVPRLLWTSTALPGANVTVSGARSAVSGLINSHLGCRSEFFQLSIMFIYQPIWRQLKCLLFSSWLTPCLGHVMCHMLFVLLLATEWLRCSRFSSTPPSTDVTYEQLKQLLAGRKAVVIDVREPWELREYGFIPGSINVPRECCSPWKYTYRYLKSHSLTLSDKAHLWRSVTGLCPHSGRLNPIFSIQSKYKISAWHVKRAH